MNSEAFVYLAITCVYMISLSGPLTVPFTFENTAFMCSNAETKKLEWPDIQLHIQNSVYTSQASRGLNMAEEVRNGSLKFLLVCLCLIDLFSDARVQVMGSGL